MRFLVDYLSLRSCWAHATTRLGDDQDVVPSLRLDYCTFLKAGNSNNRPIEHPSQPLYSFPNHHTFTDNPRSDPPYLASW
jgi:hypothetical protein